MPTLFFRIAWMKDYQGNPETDVPKGAGSHVDENHNGGEIYNFYPLKGYYYGYVRTPRGNNLQLDMLTPGFKEDKLTGVTVVFFAKNPDTGGQYVIGWYKNAILYKKKQTTIDGWSYQAKAKIVDSYLVPVDRRVFPLPKRSSGQSTPGQANVWYISYYNSSFEKETLTYIEDPEKYLLKKAKKIRVSTPWQPVIELRKKVEEEAMSKVYEYYTLRDYKVEYVHTENRGWDLEATLGKQIFLLEVKGLSGPFRTIELTPNEYSNAKVRWKVFRLCIVSHALDKEIQKLDIYHINNEEKWVNAEGDELAVIELVSGRFTKV